MLGTIRRIKCTAEYRHILPRFSSSLRQISYDTFQDCAAVSGSGRNLRPSADASLVSPVARGDHDFANVT